MKIGQYGHIFGIRNMVCSGFICLLFLDYEQGLG